MTPVAKKPRRKRCSRCGELHAPETMTPVGGDRYCETCLVLEADGVPDAPEAEASSAPGDPALAGSILGDPLLTETTDAGGTAFVGAMTEQVAADLMPDHLGDNGDPNEPRSVIEQGWVNLQEAQDGGFLPAPSTQIDAPMPDLATEDEKVDAPRPWMKLPNWNTPGWPLRHGRISASALGAFLRCPEQFRRKYVKGEPERWGASGIIGTGIHKALERSDRFRMEQGEPLPLPLAIEAFDASISREFGKQEERYGSVEWGHDGSRAKKPMDEAQWRERGGEVIKRYSEEIAPQYQPLRTEDLFIVAVPGVAVPVCGFIDVVTPYAMVDRKFGAKRSFSVAADWRIQALTYMLSHDLRMEWHSMNWSGEWATPSGTPALSLPATAENYAIGTSIVSTLVRAILTYAETFGPDNPWPGNLAHTWACSTCSFRDEGDPPCAWWHRNMSQPVL